jgi:type II secretory pathway component GspD/PulD (secretin)
MRAAQAGALLTAAVLVITAPAAAEVRVTDAGGGLLVIEARDATIQEILDKVGESRPIRFQTSEALSRHVTGTYAGTLPRALSRLLEGYDYVIRSGPSGVQLDMLNAGQPSRSRAPVVTAATAVRVPAATPANTVNLASGPHPVPSPVRPSRAPLFGDALRPVATTSP